ncbi:hypothetical protein AH553_24540 [Salmonella enterica subsp. diarizonae]|nr:hypothetical protein [Salmonella enterica subsp. diarizonae]
MNNKRFAEGFSMFTSLFEESGAIPWYHRGNPQFAASRPLSHGEISTIQEAVTADPVAIYCLLLPELRKRKIDIEARFSCVTSRDDSKAGYSFINNYGQVPGAIGVKASRSERTFTDEERHLFEEMAASDPAGAIRKGVWALQEQGVITSAWYLLADGNHNQ